MNQHPLSSNPNIDSSIQSCRNALYSPTPVEEAYGIHLLLTTFNVAPNAVISAVSSGNASFKIPGKNAVQFLSGSGIDRSILRNAWAVSDPGNIGSLTEINQLHIILRLVALAQSGTLLTDALAAAQTPTQAMQICLKNTQGVELNHLAFFQGTAIPNRDYLMQLYFQYHPSEQVSAIMPPQTQIRLSVEDAFSGLVEVENKPLPSLEMKMPQPSVGSGDPMPVQTTTGTADDDDDDFGEFTSGPASSPNEDGTDQFGGCTQPSKNPSSDSGGKNYF